MAMGAKAWILMPLQHVLIRCWHRTARRWENVSEKEEETYVVDGCKVRIRYAEQGNPAAIKTMWELLEQQKLPSQSPQKLTEMGKM